MAKQPTEDELNLRRKARRRLVGAVALTLIVIVVLPMVLDSEPKPSGQDIDLRIPAPDKVGAFTPKPPPAVLSASVPVAVATTEVAASVTKANEPAVTPPVVEKTAAKVETVAAEVAKPAMTEANQTTTAVQSYVAQVGAYNNAESAHKVLTELKGRSFKAYSEKSGDKIRVRVGPYAEKDKVEKVMRMLEKHDLHPVIVTLP